MDPRQSLARTNSANLPPTSYNPNMMATYTPYPNQNTHLPPIHAYAPQMQQPGQNYMPPQYRPELPRYQSAPAPAPAPDRFGPQMPPQSSMNGLPHTSMLPQPNGQPQQPQSYSNPPSAGPTYQQRLAPAPPRPPLDPLSTSFQQQQDRPPMWTGPEQIPSMTTDLGRDPNRTHVVGSQGRRGILPSAPGRAPVMPNGINGQPKGNAIPQKDQDGKFPCPNCNKTYLHAKHLKRHMLRHTGDRPYMCVLCNDTFSRSDILKRHFQKCSVRRGNPTGASHLSNPAAHLKKSQQAKASTDSPNSTTTPSNGPLGSAPFTTTSMGPGSLPATSAPFTEAPSMTYSMPNATSADMQRPVPAHSIPSSNGQTANSHAWSMQNSRNPLLYHPNSNSPDHFDKRHVMQAPQHMENDWNQMFSHDGGNAGYMNQMFGGYEHPQHDGKKEEYAGPEGGSNYYIPPNGLGPDGMLGPLPWNLASSQEDPLQLKAEHLVDFCFPVGIQDSLQEQQNSFHVRSCLTPRSIKHFLARFANFQSHFAYLHLGTFDFLHAYDGLVLVILCIGAAYSSVPQSQVRDLMARTKTGIERTSRLLRASNSTHPLQLSASGVEFEELQALLMLLTFSTWHGGPEQRAAARADSPNLFHLIRRLQLLELEGSNDQSAFSYLHHLSPGSQPDPSQWSWRAWVEQEKRSRLMYLAFLLDAALALYFNCHPQFSPSEIHIPLPCDDAAWEAQDGEKCAQTLGLRGQQLQRATNASGSLQFRQPSVQAAVNALHISTITIQPLSTNVYGKFITVHALLTEVWQVQRQRSIAGPSPISTPHNGTQSPGPLAQIRSNFRSISGAIARWKQSWDQDMQLQYPPNGNVNHCRRRFGFSRDGVHFYWLARALLQPNRINDWRSPPDVQFQRAMNGLKQAREWSRSDGARRGEEPGSVYDMDDDYGVEGLELDMTKLFRPIEETPDSPPAHTGGFTADVN